MLQKRIQDTSHTKGGLNHTGCKLDLMNRFRRFFVRQNHILGNGEIIKGGATGFLQRFDKLFLKGGPVFGHFFNESRNDPLVLLKGLPEEFAIELEFSRHLFLLGLVEFLSGQHGGLGDLAVHVQIETRPIGVSHALNPAIGGLDFQIPTIGCIMSHFRRQVLPKPETFWIHPNLFQKELRPGHKISQRLIIDKTRLDRLTNGHFGRLSVAQLIDITKQNQLLVRHRGKIGVRLVIWIHKMLNFTHGKLSHTQQTRPRRNLVTEPKTDLSGRKRHLLGIGVQKSAKVDKESLCGFGSKVSHRGALGSDAGGEHEVKGEGG
mmetsp:Transcript_22306/g.40241  ORF Transcript_22306/g.40241 Transcript_22306/m.40241 type:complete len:320 (-) Transcript_22306:742-1701(-)